MWNFLVSRKGTISNAWFFPPWRPECLTSQQIKSVEIRKTVFLQYDECLALQQIKSIKARKTPCEEIFVFSLTEVLVPSIETLNHQLFLAEVLWKGTNEKMTDIGFSAKQTDDSIHIRVFHKNMFFKIKISATHHALAWGLVWSNPKGFLISTKFKGS